MLQGQAGTKALPHQAEDLPAPGAPMPTPPSSLTKHPLSYYPSHFSASNIQSHSAYWMNSYTSFNAQAKNSITESFPEIIQDKE